MYAIVSIGGTMPPSRFGTILRFNTPCVLPQRTDLRRYRGGQLTQKAGISASFVIRRMDQFLCLFMGAARTSWVHGTLEQIQGPHILRTTPSYPRKRSGPGVSTQKVLVGVRHSPTTTAPM